VGSDLIAVVEIPKGSSNKYEWDDELGAIKLDRLLFSSLGYPTDYGFFRNTLAADGDPLDAMIVVSEPTFPGCLIEVKPVALFRMRDLALLLDLQDARVEGRQGGRLVPARGGARVDRTCEKAVRGRPAEAMISLSEGAKLRAVARQYRGHPVLEGVRAPHAAGHQERERGPRA
jgi:hypothetical protein